MHQFPRGGGWIEVICGSMFAGKTQELIRRLRLAAIARQKVQVFKHKLDIRYAKEDLVSHDQLRVPSVPVSRAQDILDRVRTGTQVVGIDEDYRLKPFESMARLMAVAEDVTKNLAICLVCGGPAGRSQRVSEGKKRIDVGHADKYEARCRHCFRPEVAR